MRAAGGKECAGSVIGDRVMIEACWYQRLGCGCDSDR